MKKVFIFYMVLFICSYIEGQNPSREFVVGNEQIGSNVFCANNRYSTSEDIYYPEGIGCAGTINKISFCWLSGSSYNYSIEVYLSMTDAEYTATFEEDEKFEVVVMANDSTRGSTTAGGMYYAGDQITIRATANDHYYFSEWSDGSSENPRVVTVIGNMTYTANFVPNPYVVTVTANDLSMGNVSGGGTYEYGTEIAIMATAYPGHRFVRWLDGDANMERTITVLDNCYYQAIFEVENTEGIEDVCSADYSVTTSRLKIEVSQIQGRKMEVFDISGRRIAYIEKSGETESVAVPTKGVYMIQVDGTKPKKVVVM